MTSLRNSATTVIATKEPNRLVFRTVLIGCVDGKEIDLRGHGVIGEAEGFTEGEFDIRRLPDHIDPRSLGAFLFTGYPNSCRTSDAGIGNPFSGGSYTYTRRYTFSQSHKTAELRVTCNLAPDRLSIDSVFELSGNFPALGAVSAVTPIYELWSPSPDGVINGVFNVGWLQESSDAALEVATATSEYNPVRAELMHGKTKHRFIRLESHLTPPNRLHVAQWSNLLDQAHIPY